MGNLEALSSEQTVETARDLNGLLSLPKYLKVDLESFWHMKS